MEIDDSLYVEPATVTTNAPPNAASHNTDLGFAQLHRYFSPSFPRLGLSGSGDLMFVIRQPALIFLTKCNPLKSGFAQHCSCPRATPWLLLVFHPHVGPFQPCGSDFRNKVAVVGGGVVFVLSQGLLPRFGQRIAVIILEGDRS